MTLLVSEIHPGNVLVYWMLSFVMRVEALYFHPLCARLAVTRIGEVGGGDVFSSKDGWAFRGKAEKAWETLAKRIPTEDWQITCRGIALDFTTKAKQDLWRAFEDLHLLKAIQQKRGTRDVYLVRSARMAYLVGFDTGELFAGSRFAAWPSNLHDCLDRLWEGGQHAASLVRLVARLVLALLIRLAPAGETLAPCSILYLCDNPNELHESPDKRSFTWLIDGVRIRERDVLFVLPDIRDARVDRVLDGLPHTTIQAGRLQDLYRRVPAAQLIRSLAAVAAMLPSAVVAPLRPCHRLMRVRYVLSSLEFDPIVRHVRPSCCLETDSSLSIEKPALVYLAKRDVATVMCHFTALLVFYTRPGGIAARDFVYAHPIASRVVCWNEKAAELMAAHAHEGSDVVVLGPLMPGRDDLLAEDRSALRFRQLPPGTPASLLGKKWMSVFDVMPNPTLPARRPGFRAYEEPYTEDYWIGFMQDMLQVLNDDAELVMVYKPKRVHVVGQLYPVSAWFPTRANEYVQLVGTIQRHERAIVLEEDINPWIPVAVADLCISPPGGSPVCVGWHFGIPGIYHDPLGLIGPDDHCGMKSCLTADYATLQSKVKGFLYPNDPAGFSEPWHSEGLRPYVGRAPGSNANGEFREFLDRLAQGNRVPLATPDVVSPQLQEIQ